MSLGPGNSQHFYGLKADSTDPRRLSTWDPAPAANSERVSRRDDVGVYWRAVDHMMVVYGAGVTDADSLVYVKDPMPVDSGASKVYTYAAYVRGSGYTHWNDYYNIRP